MAYKFYSAVKFLRLPSHCSARYLHYSPKSPNNVFSSKSSNRKQQRRHRLLEPYKAMSAIRIEENPDKLKKIFKEASDHPRFHCHRSAYAIAVKQLAQAGRPDAIEEILEREKNKPQLKANEGFMLRIITLYGQAGMPYHAVKTFHQLPQLNIQPGVKSLNALLNSLRHTGNYAQVRYLYREIVSNYNINPNLNTFNIVINSLCEMGLSENAFLMLDEMRKQGCCPNVELFNAILRGFYKEGKPHDAPRVLEKMTQIGCLPDVSTLNIRVLYLCREGRSCEAKELLSVMRTQGVKPNAWSYNMLINGFCKERNLLEANRVFEGMAGKGFDPDRRSYFSFVYHLCVEEEFEWALEVCEVSIRKNWVPNASIVQMLVDGLVKVSKAKEARGILAEARSRARKDCIGPLDEIGKKLLSYGKTG